MKTLYVDNFRKVAKECVATNAKVTWAIAFAASVLLAPSTPAHGFDFGDLFRPFPPHDGGGDVLGYFEQVRVARVSGQRVVIDGVCSSACTMKLGAPNVCVTPDATLRFHSASAKNGSRSSAGNTILMSVYPPAIRRWVRENSALASQRDFVEMSGREARRLGIRSCALP